MAQESTFFPASFVRGTMKGLLEALAYMHSEDLAHLDIKPENVLVTSEDVLKLCDFGITRRIKSDETVSGRVGTLTYMAPETRFHNQLCQKSDIWALGLVFYQLTTLSIIDPSKAKYSLEDASEIKDEFYDQIRVNVTEEAFDTILEPMLQSDPDTRPTAEELLSSIDFDSEADLHSESIKPGEILYATPKSAFTFW